MSTPPLLPSKICQRCGATNPPIATTCWLCEGRGAVNPYAATAPLQPMPDAGPPANSWAQSRVEIICLGLLGMAIILAVLVGVGIGVQDPGMLIPYLIVAGPPFLATGVRALASAGRSQKPTPSKLFLTFVWSTMFTVLALVLLVVASVLALIFWCISVLSNGPH